MRIVLIILAAVVLALGAGAVALAPRLAAGASEEGSTGSGLFRSRPTGLEVRIEAAKDGTLVETIQAPGEIEPHTFVRVSAEVSARIDQLPFEEGDEVRRGDLVAKLDDRDLQASLTSAKARRDGERFRLQSDQARLEGLRSRLEYARNELERMRSLHETGDVALRDFEGAMERVDDLSSSVESTTLSIAVVESSLASAEADIERAEDAIGKTTIRAPIDGFITRLDVEVGEVVTGSLNNPGTVMMTIADLSRMVHIAEIAESDVARVAIGQKARLHINAYDDEVFTGTVRHIALQRSGAADGTGHFRTEIEIDLQGRRIRSGLIANADVEIETHRGVVVPYQAILAREIDALPDRLGDHPLVDRTRRHATVVYVEREGKAVCTPVRAGASDLTHRVVLEGLAEGEEIVIGPFKVLEGLKDGAALRRAEDEAAKPSGDAVAEAAPEAEPALAEEPAAAGATDG